MRQFKRTWGDHDGDRGGFHFGDFFGHSHRPHESHGSHGPHGSPCQPDPQPAKIEYRSFDGSQNNRSDTTLNAAGTEFGRIGEAHFADGISVPLGRNHPRTISNLVVGAGDPDVANPEGVSAFMYACGQFLALMRFTWLEWCRRLVYSAVHGCRPLPRWRASPFL